MTSMLAKYVSKKVLGESMANNFGKDDPYFETVPATRLDGKPSKKGKKRRKALPEGISEHDGMVLTKVKRRAYRLDMSLFNCCGIRFGWSSVIGIFPVVGDILDAFMAMMVLRTCQQIEGGLPRDVQAKMMFNIILDFGVGLVPILGDIADALFRANTRNAVELEKYLRIKGLKAIKDRGHSTPPIDPTDPDVFDQQLRDEFGEPPHYSSHPPTRQGTSASNHNTRNVAPVPEQRTGGWGFGNKTKQQDVERGQDLRGNGPMPATAMQNDPRRPANTLQKNRY